MATVKAPRKTATVKKELPQKVNRKKSDSLESASIDLVGPLQEYFGFDGFKDQQEYIIRNLLNGKDTFVIMPTGGGKSLCYQLPALISEGCALIVSPLIALMKIRLIWCAVTAVKMMWPIF